jgi:hypothetical protein
MFSIMLGMGAISANAQRIAVMPTYNGSVLAVGDQMAQFLTVELFNALFQSGQVAVLVNPGGVYLPEDTDLVVVAAQSLRANQALVTKLLPVAWQGRDKTQVRMHAWLVAIPQGTITDVGTFDETLKLNEVVVEYSHEDFWGNANGSRVFREQKIGKAAQHIVEETLVATLGKMPNVISAGPKESKGPECAGTLRVMYPRNKSSKTYELLLDGRDESVLTEDGVASFKRASGSHLMVLHLNDPPYKVPLQTWYAVNFSVECPAEDLVFMIGAGGEGQLNQLVGR